MGFWDRFVWAVYFGLARHAPSGRPAAARVAQTALSRQAFAPSLGDASLAMLLALLPAGSAARALVTAEARSRGVLDPARLLAAALAATPRRVEEVVECFRPPDAETRNAALAALLEPGGLLLFENLHLFLARRFLIDPGNASLPPFVARLIARGIRNYAHIPYGTVDSIGYLYRYVCRSTGPGASLPAISPPALGPVWFANLTAPERRLVLGAMNWGEETQEAFFLHYCGLLCVERIAFVMDGQGAYDVDSLVAGLEACWEDVL